MNVFTFVRNFKSDSGELTYYGMTGEESNHRHDERSFDAFCRDGVEACSVITGFDFPPLRSVALSLTSPFVLSKLVRI